ncbi:amino acid adenylation domain-containing protein [Nonomuraea sp. NPDC004702]
MKLHRLLIESARRTPEAVAVHDHDGPVTYRALDELSDLYLSALRRRGVGRGDRVVIWTGKHVQAIAVMQAVLRLGAVYVPVAGANPAARVARIVRDAAPALVVTDEDAPGRLPAGHGLPLVPWPELAAGGDADAGGGRGELSAGGDDPAYILYTSGSTGTPKGVCLSHRNALAFVEWAVREVRVGAGDRLSNHAPFNFDLSVFDLYAAFATGASVHLVPPASAYAPHQLTDFLHERAITVWYSVPSVLTLMCREGGLLDREPPPGLRACVFAGEPFPLQHVRALRKHWPGVRLLNWYGPTETNVCTSYEVSDADLDRDRPLPIGRACAGDTVTLSSPDDDGVGEIVVEGPTVMLGYWGGERLTGPYRTGDFGRLDADGELHYVGRRDHLVKVRGNRVELGEIETALGGLGSVAEVAVLAAGEGDHARLYAFVVPAPGRRPSLLEVKRHCAGLLPPYMNVDRLRLLETLPRTPNGKTDRALLLAMTEEGGPR